VKAITTPRWLILELASACFLAFSWALRWHFHTPGRTPPGVWLICALSVLGYLWVVLDVLRGPLGPAWPVSLLLLAAAFVVFLLTLRASSGAGLTVAFVSDQPLTLLKRGPYKYVRHPFYATYLAFWTATAAARPGWEPWTVPAVFGAIYWVAARREEAKFEDSSFSMDYAVYRRQAGMFLPRPSSLVSFTHP
jgi:protein-S-isoprenylcysteine O-methyltransferase Ste14